MVGILTGASFAAGLNVYATVATLGVLGRTGVLPLPASLHTLESWPVIAVSVAMFIVEFFADKVPAFDLLWNAFHTFVRIPVAALIAYGATSHLSPGAQLLSALLGAAIAFAAHGGKLALRAAVTPSPEPVSNIALSLTEDAAAVGLTWFASRHPYATAAIVAVLVLLVIVTIRWVTRALKRLFRGAKRELAEV